jgi:UDP-3-O-[3-hydroxymyristoyl] glucosamine N-acyltransferase
MKAALLQSLLLVLPWPLRRRLLILFFGYDIAPDAGIGFSLIFADQLTLARGARIGHLTVVKSLRRLEIHEAGRLGNLNWITGFPVGGSGAFSADAGRDPSLIIEREAAVTNRHLIDCTDRVTIGEFTTLAGWRSQIVTHAIDLRTSRQTAAPVTIGRYCFIGTGVILLKGASLPDYCVLAAGSVLAESKSVAGTLYSGVPAVAVKTLDTKGSYFTRARGFVH